MSRPLARHAIPSRGVADQVSIPERFRGPPDSGHGGYSCALVAQFIDGPAEVTLRRPPPLERALEVQQDSGSVKLLEGDAVVAEARPVELELDVPEPVSVAQATEAATRSPLLDYHPFGTCFVCGTDREEGDGLRLFAGPVDGRALNAVPWTPDPSLAASDGAVRIEFVWSVLDCPSATWVTLADTSNPCVLARFATRIVRPIECGAEHVAVGWPISREGRKLHTGAAIYTADGEVCAFARALWIELTDEQLQDVGTTTGA
jgi:hypothetical protein